MAAFANFICGRCSIRFLGFGFGFGFGFGSDFGFGFRFAALEVLADIPAYIVFAPLVKLEALFHLPNHNLCCLRQSKYLNSRWMIDEQLPCMFDSKELLWKVRNILNFEHDLGLLLPFLNSPTLCEGHIDFVMYSRFYYRL